MIYSNEVISPLFVCMEADVIAHNYSSGYEFTLLNSFFSTYWCCNCENLFSPEVLERVSSSLKGDVYTAQLINLYVSKLATINF